MTTDPSPAVIGPLLAEICWMAPPMAVLGVGGGVVRAQGGMEYTCCWTGGRIMPEELGCQIRELRRR